MHACIYVCILVYVYVWVYTYVYACMLWSVYMYESMFVWVHVFGCVLQRFRFVRWDPDPIRINACVDPIHTRFEDRSMRWSVDQYRFVQWRPHDDSVPKPRHFMWVFVIVDLPLSVCIYMLLLSFYVTSVIFYQFDFLYHFMRQQWLFTLIV